MKKIRCWIRRTRLFVGAMLARFRVALDRLAPMGYEDDAGFHLGVEDRVENQTH